MTVQPLHLFAEPFAPNGGADAAAQQNAFGRSWLSPWETFLRETVQNSWDARTRDESTSIDFEISWKTLSPEARQTLTSTVFVNQPAASLDLFTVLGSDEDVAILRVEDRRTRGLGGPTRADIAVASGERTDFRDFVRNFGRDKDKKVGGGTFGIGKAVLYRASSVSTTLIYTQTRDASGNVEARFIAVHASDSYQAGNKNFTGRHFWGLKDPADADGALAEPVTGDDARSIAVLLGLTTLAENETGTSIAVVQPLLLTDETRRTVIEQLAAAAGKWAWPHIIHRNEVNEPAPTIRFRFFDEQDEVAVPNPESSAETRSFAWAFLAGHQVKAGEKPIVKVEHEPIFFGSGKSKRLVGDLFYQAAAPLSSADKQESSERTAVVALMRDPRFIVKYLEVSVPNSRLNVVGVFIADAEFDEAFALTEPVAHDDWKPSGRGGAVNAALNRISKSLRAKFGSTAVRPVTQGHTGLTRLTRELGGILSSGMGPGAGTNEPSPPSGGGSKKRRGPRVEISSDVSYVEKTTSGTVTDFAFSLSHPPEAFAPGAALLGDAWVVDGTGARESEPPKGSLSPQVLGWVDAGGTFHASEESFAVASTGGSAGALRVLIPEGSAVRVSITVEGNDS